MYQQARVACCGDLQFGQTAFVRIATQTGSEDAGIMHIPAIMLLGICWRAMPHVSLLLL